MAPKIPMEIFFFRMFKLTVLLLKDCNITSVTCNNTTKTVENSEKKKKLQKYSHSIFELHYSYIMYKYTPQLEASICYNKKK